MNIVDYHVHTKLCEHATGSVDEYICNAITKNIAEIGFSDHAPLPEGKREGITMLPEQTEQYINQIEILRETYKDKIIVKLAFEVDFPLTNSFNRKYLLDARLDYLIGSCHFINDWAFDHPDNIDEFKKRDIDQIYLDYYTIIDEIANSGYFNIIGHFDIVKKFGHRSKKDFCEIIHNIASTIAKTDISVEINTSGLRKPVSEIYPSDEIIEILFLKNVPITLSSDAHKPDEVGYFFNSAIEKIKKIGYRKISGYSKKRRYDIYL